MFNKHTSGLFVYKNKNLFGGQQADYLQHVETIVSKGVSQLSDIMNNNQSLDLFFDQLLSFISTSRQEIAVKHNTANKEIFGVRRDNNSKWIATMVTKMVKVYQEYNERIGALLFPYLQAMPHDKTHFYQTYRRIPLDSFMDRATYLDIRILTQENASEWMYNHDDDYAAICKFCNIPFNPQITMAQALNEMRQNKSLMLTLKEKSLILYEKVHYAHSFSGLISNREQGFKISDVLLVTINQEIGDKTIQLSRYLTWLYRDGVLDPFEKMRQESIFYILHQDAFVIEESIRNIFVLFKQAMELAEVNEQELTTIMALINYEFAQSMPFARGSASICEYLEMIIYGYYGYHVQYKADTSINMEALILPLKQFTEQYPSMLKLELTPLDTSFYADKKELEYETTLLSALNNNGALKFTGLYDERFQVDAVAAINKPAEMAKAREIQKKLNAGTLYAISDQRFFVVPKINVETDLGAKIEQTFIA